MIVLSAFLGLDGFDSSGIPGPRGGAFRDPTAWNLTPQNPKPNLKTLTLRA